MTRILALILTAVFMFGSGKGEHKINITEQFVRTQLMEDGGVRTNYNDGEPAITNIFYDIREQFRAVDMAF